MDIRTKDGITLRGIPDGTPEADIKARIATIRANRGTAAPAPAQPKDSLLQTLLSPFEAAATIGSGAIAAPAAGLAGLATASPENVGRVQEALTYQPRSQAGQSIVGAVSYPFQKLSEGADYVGQKVADVAGPAAGAGVKTAIESAPMLLTPAAGRGARARVTRQANDLNTARGANAITDAARERIRQAGYVAPPSLARPGVATATADWVSGSGRLTASATRRNQATTNRLARESLNLRRDQPLADSTLQQLRQQHGQAYEAVRQVRQPMITNPAYRNAINNLGRANSQAAQQFPGIMRNVEVDALRTQLNSGPNMTMTFDAAVDLVRELRHQSTQNFRSVERSGGNPAQQGLARAQREAADALDDLIADNLQQRFGRGDLFNNYQTARQQIARSYDIEAALNETTGNVSAAHMARLNDRGRPLGDQLETIAQAHEAFGGQATRMPERQAPRGLTMTDIGLGAAAGYATHPALALAGAAARPVMRAAMLSGPIQNMLMRPQSYQPSLRMRALAAALENPAAPLVVGGMQ